MSTYGQNTIVQEVISAQTVNAVKVLGASFARTLKIPANWTKLRVGMRVLWTQPIAIPNNASLLTGPPLFAVGLCHGTTHIFGDPTADHFVGVVSDGNWTSETSEYLYDFITLKGAVKVGASTTLSSTLNTGGLGQFGQGTNAAWAPTPQNYFVDITKGSPNFTINTFYISNGQVCGAQSRATFLADVVLASPAEAGQAFGASPASMAVNEGTNGALDSVCVSWNRSDFWPEICDLAIVMLSP